MQMICYVVPQFLKLQNCIQICHLSPASLGTALQWLSSLEAVDLSPLPSSQLPLLVSSYNEAISQLEDGSADKVIVARAMHELGNLHFHNRNKKSVSLSK